MPSVLKIENLWKQYRLGTIGHGTLRQDMQSWWARIWGKEDPNVPINLPTNGCGVARDRIWALKNVSIEVKQGEVLGIIGRNGAGKSTLFKVISRITAPTRGRIKIKGRVASLLEVGTGFHQELTGRENIFLNGAILGMRVGEIRRKFDEIVDFSGVEKFIDTPVKRYSSGMYVRLAFAVAAHLNSEIMIVDEVLSVGDAAFQKKCLGKMGDVAKTGRTVLFVSHNIAAIQKLCSIACLLDRGQLVFGGSTDEVVAVYSELISDEENPEGLPALTPESYLGKVSFRDWRVGDSMLAQSQYSSFTGEPLTFQFTLAVGRTIPKANFGITLYANDGTLVWSMRNLDHDGPYLFLEKGIYRVQFKVPYFPLRPGGYQILVSANDMREGTLAEWRPRKKLNILPKNESGLPATWQGILNITGEFDLMLLKNISDLE